VLSTFGSLPTGKTKLREQEAEVAGTFAADLLPFRVSNWGTGGSIGVASSVAHTFGRTSIGVSAAYTLGREFAALAAQDFAYRPGNELRARAALDARVGAAASISLEGTIQKAAVDKLNGQNLYQPGTRVHAQASFAFPAGERASGVVYAGVLHRAAGDFLLRSAIAPTQDLVLAGTALRLPIGRAVLQPSTDLRVFRSADAAGQGWLLSAGTVLELPLTDRALIAPAARLRFGSVNVRDDVRSGIHGFDVGLIIRQGRTR
jgi:hypothetical protein